MPDKQVKKIAIVIRLLSLQGGYYAYLRALIPELQRDGRDVVMIVITKSNLRADIANLLPSIKLHFCEQPKIGNLYLQWQLYQLLRTIRARAIFVNDLYESLFLFPYKLFHLKTRLFVVIHSTLRDMPGSRRSTVWFIYTFHKLFQFLVTKYISVSRYGAEQIYVSGIKKNNVIIIPNGLRNPVGRQEVKAHANPIQVGFVGRFSHEKGPDVFLAIAGACKDLPLRFTMYGTGPLETSIRKQLESIGNCKVVNNKADAQEIFSHIDILIIPSRSEGQPYAVLEAFQNDVLVIGSKVGGLPELLEDNGILIEPNEPEVYRTKLQYVLKSPVEIIKIKKHAKEYMSNKGGALQMGRRYLELFTNG